MEWFPKLDVAVQMLLIVGACFLATVLIVNVRQLFEKPTQVTISTETTTDFEKSWADMLKSLKKVNDGAFHLLHYDVEVKPRKPAPPQGGSGTAPPQKKDGPKLELTRYYVRRGDGMFYRMDNKFLIDWVSKAQATTFTCPVEAERIRKQSVEDNQPGISFRVVSDEVEA